MADAVHVGREPAPLSSNPRQNAAAPGKSGARGRYAAKACQECRRRRAKCDGQKPTCSRCSGRQLECIYTTEDDGRGMAPKAYVRQLQARIQILEEILRMHSIDIDASAAQLMQRNVVPQSSTTDVLATAIDQLCDAVEGALALDESMNFDQDGEARYFGTTSGRLEFRCSDDAQDLSPRGHSSLLTELHEPAFGDQVIVDQEVEAHLLDLYFIWDNPWFQVVDEALFRDSKTNKGRYYSPLLLHCILACGSRYSDRVEARSDPGDANTAGRPFLDMIEALLHDELKRPNITTIQSLAILSIVYFGSGQDAAGWLYSGMANRLVFDMGLHLDPDSLASSVRMTVEEAGLRRQLYWALTGMLYVGEIPSIKAYEPWSDNDGGLKDFQGAVKLPEIPKHAQQSDPRHTLYSVSPMMSVGLHTSWIKLSQIMERILSSLYAPKKLSLGDQRRNFFDSTLLELKSWLYGLCTALKPIQGGIPNRFPQAYTLCMVYHTIVILLARPYIQRPRPYSLPQAPLQQVDSLAQKTVTIYIEAARSISSLGDQYRQVFGSFRKSPLVATYANLSAALALLDPVCQSRESRGLSEADEDRIKSCLQTLNELSVAWRPPAKYHCSIMKIMHKRMGSERREVRASDSVVKQTGQRVEHDAGPDQVTRNLDLPFWMSTAEGSSSRLEESPDTLPFSEADVRTQLWSDMPWEHFVWNWPESSFWGENIES
ncbi:Zn(2)-C6 fungal-type domain-containing protein [Fusarium sp. Ph1]|nr:Zn(2)-C6 fungal-type domain-containing protein [Fusarium sp. Ph1]